jgi:hypothetical protein
MLVEDGATVNMKQKLVEMEWYQQSLSTIQEIIKVTRYIIIY